MTILTGIRAAVSGTRGVILLAGAAVSFATGFAAAEVYENKVPWGLGARLTKLTNSLPARLDAAETRGAHAQFELDKPVIEEWRGRLESCEAGATAASRLDAETMERALGSSVSSRQAAYRLGLSSCRAERRDESTDTTGINGTAGILPDDTELGDILGGARYTAPTD